MQRVLAKAGVINRVGEKVLVFRDGKGPERHERMALRQFVAIEDDLFRRLHRALPPAVDSVL